MKRTLAAILVLAALAAPLSGCASIFDQEYLTIENYAESTATPQQTEGSVAVENYLELKLAINKLVTAHEERGSLDFSGYDGENIRDDLASACNDVRSETALAAYAVDYISYDLDRLVSYYEAEVFIYYLHTQEELDSIVSVSTVSGLYDAICDALEEMSTELVVMVNASGAGEAEVIDYVTEAYFADPLSCVNRPQAEVTMYTGGGLQRIYEINLDYGASSPTLKSRKEILTGDLEDLAARVTAQGSAYRALQAATVIMESCRSDAEAGGTFWDAVHLGSANSEGMALAFKALCDMVGVECLVVSGRLDRAEHYWNIITVDGASYHVDVSAAAELGLAGTFLISDSDMWGHYWWDNEKYPQCEGSLSYSALIEEPDEPSPETSPDSESPSPSQSPSTSEEPDAENSQSP